MLKNDIAFKVNKKEKVEFDGIPYAFSEELVELKYIEKYYRYKAQGCNYDYIRNDYLPDSFFKIWNWRTVEGKAFCEMIRYKENKKKSDYDSKHNYIRKYKKYLNKFGIKYNENIVSLIRYLLLVIKNIPRIL